MDSLTALRTAIIAGRVDAIRLQDGSVVIDGNSYPAMGETAFQSKSLKRRYKLLSLWIQYRARDVGYAEHLRMAKEAGIAVQDMVLLPEKKIVVDYLSGASTATDFVDPAPSQQEQEELPSIPLAHRPPAAPLLAVLCLRTTPSRWTWHCDEKSR